MRPSPADSASGPLISPRLGLLLLVLLASLASFNVGVFAVSWRGVEIDVWLWAALLLVIDAGCWWAAWHLLPPGTHRPAEEQPASPDDPYEQAPCGYFALDAMDHVLRINDIALSWLGYSRDDVVHRPITDLLPPASRMTALAGHSTRDVELQLLRHDGTLLHGLFSSAIVRDANGGYRFTSVLFVDITERKKSEERLAELSARLHAVLSAATELAVIAYDLDGRITLFNPGAERMLGYRAYEMLGREGPWNIHLASEVRAHGERLQAEYGRPLRGFDVLAERARQQGHEEREWTYVRKDGSLLTVNLVVTGVRNSGGQLQGFLALATDVSERNRARERLNMTMSAARIGTWDWDILHNRTTWSDNVYDLLGTTPGETEMTLEGFLALVVPEDREAMRANVEAALADPDKGERYQAEFRLRGSDGQLRWMADQGRVFRDERGRPVRMMGTVMDVTERRRAAELLQGARDAAQSANEAKSSFLANVSHEIRTPLNGIIGMIELLQQTPVSAQQRGYLDTLVKSAETLLSLITDVLDISKVEADKLDLEEVPFDVRDLAQQAVSMVSAQAGRKGLALTCEVGPQVPGAVVGDPGRLRQVLLNLLANAVKFTSRGEVSLTVQGSAAIAFTVRDTGIGIAADRLTAIFEPFTQADTSTARTHGGTGLGLTISARLVARMGGKLQVESTPGKGSTFSFTLALPLASRPVPVASVEKPAAIAVNGVEAPSATGQGVSLLLVEDNPVNQEVMTLLLEKAGYKVRLAANGEEALIEFEKEQPRVILMDLQMPEMDGLRATRLIRAREKAIGGHVPIIAVTANALQGERQRCLAAGMDDYLAKPIRGSELFLAIERLIGVRGAAEVVSATPRESEDWLVGLEGMGFDRSAIARLARTFLDTVPPRLVFLRQALSERNASGVHVTAHSLKGSLAVFGVKPAIEAAGRLEQLGQQQKLDEGEAVLADLEREVEPLVGSMHEYLQSTS